MNITDMVRDPSLPVTGDAVVNAIEAYVAPSFTTAFYASCVDVTFGDANVPAMFFIGGGATTPQAFLDYMGNKQPLGQSFTTVFILTEDADAPIVPWNGTAVTCFDGSPTNTCPCKDCPAVCPPDGPLRERP